MCRAPTGNRMSPVNAAEIAAQNGVGIFTIGVGDPGSAGEVQVDLRALEDISGRAGGRYFVAADEAGLAAAAILALMAVGWLHLRLMRRAAW